MRLYNNYKSFANKKEETPDYVFDSRGHATLSSSNVPEPLYMNSTNSYCRMDLGTDGQGLEKAVKSLLLAIGCRS